MVSHHPNQIPFSLLLISTASKVYAYGLRILAARLHQERVKTDMLFTRSTNAFDNAIRKQSTKLLSGFEKNFLAFIKPYSCIGFSLMTDNFSESNQLALMIKTHYPEKHIIYGGFHPTIMPEDCLTYCDSVCVGEGFIAFPEFVKTLKNLSHSPLKRNTPSLPSGIWTHISPTQIVKNGTGALCPNLDTLPFPAYNYRCTYLRNNDNTISPFSAKAYIRCVGYSYFTMMSLGCPYSCTYCGNNALKQIYKNTPLVRWHSPKYIVDEIVAAQKMYPFFSIWFMDDSFLNMPDAAFETFISLYKEKVGMPFVLSGIIPRLAIHHKTRLEKLFAIGMVRGRLGVQTGSQRLLSLYKRPQKTEEVIAASKLFAEHKKQKVTASYDIILDGPGENEQDIFETLSLVNQLYRPIILNLFSLRYYPKTEIAQHENIQNAYSDSFLCYRPIIGNFLIGLVTFFRLPPWLFRWVAAHKKILVRRMPSFLLACLNAAIVAKRVFSHMTSGDFGSVPHWLVFAHWGKKPSQKNHH